MSRINVIFLTNLENWPILINVQLLPGLQSLVKTKSFIQLEKVHLHFKFNLNKLLQTQRFENSRL